MLSLESLVDFDTLTGDAAEGRDLFFSVGCTSCHGGLALDGGLRNTFVETLEDELGVVMPTPTVDTGSSGSFSTLGLVGGVLDKAGFFHSNAEQTSIELDEIGTAFDPLRAAVDFYNTGGVSETGISMTPAEVDKITAFLKAINFIEE